MTTIAWDGQVLAADKQATTDTGIISSVTKVVRLTDGTLLGWSGPVENGLQLVEWYKAGALAGAWPACQSKDHFAILIVVLPDGLLYEYEAFPIAQPVEDAKMAWGSGKLAALAAMYCGADAATAVEIAGKFDIWTGGGATTLRLESKADQ